MDPRQVVIKPIVSEKSYGLQEQNVYTFQVHVDSNKIEIRQAIEAIFGVKVARVNTHNKEGKRKRNRKNGTFGKRASTKRAIISLQGDDRIDLFES